MRFMPVDQATDEQPWQASLLDVRLLHLDQLVWFLHSEDPYRKAVPVTIQSAGSLTVDMRGGMARLDRDIRITKTTDGQIDQLQCDELTARFSQVPQLGSPASQLRFERVLASGSPAIFRSSHAETNSDETASRNEVARQYEIASPSMEYQLESQTFVAAGPGAMTVRSPEASSENESTGKLQTDLAVQWNHSVRWEPRDEQMQLVIDHGARCQTPAGSVSARAIRALFDVQRRAGPTTGGLMAGQLRPRQISAAGDVELRSDHVEAKTNNLDVRFREPQRLPKWPVASS